MTLERQSQQADESRTQPCTDTDLDRHRIKVLLIDPNTEYRERIAARVRSTSDEYSVVATSSGEAALLLCRLIRFDCVVTELDLPDMSGFQVLLSLVPRPDNPEVAVIVLTWTSDPLHRKFSLNNGARACLFKLRTSGDVVATAIREAVDAVKSAQEDRNPTA
jgi:DNA-binding NarL/FixJ family response regulator